MSAKINIVMAQLNFLVGDIAGNSKKILDACISARDDLSADVIVFPELALCGYPPEDLLLRNDLYQRVEKKLQQLAQHIHGIDVIIGYPKQVGDERYNAAGYIRNGKIVTEYHKQYLPNYSVFDEQRYFDSGTQSATLIDLKGIPTALVICEDLWHPGPTDAAAKAGAQLILCINASPFERQKFLNREHIAAARVSECGIPILYVNTIGGQDELVFDGGSFALNAEGKIVHHAPFFEESLEVVTINVDPVRITSSKTVPPMSDEQRLYEALVLGVRDYIEKNRFNSALVGLSGGIDSALTLAIASDAIGAKNVEAVLMPSRYTSDMSIHDASLQCENLGIEDHVISIEPTYQAMLDTLIGEFGDRKHDATEENIQARIRGMILMAISNKKGAIVLSTGNKSELSVGYATLYGDMVGGFCVLKDLPKYWVYRLANYRNSISPVIPQNVIDRAPSAELAPNQLDQDTLPPYDILDKILEQYVELDKSPQEMIEQGFDADTVHKVVGMVDRNEYKRHQAPVGVRLSARAFGKDRRYPITSGYHRGQ